MNKKQEKAKNIINLLPFPQVLQKLNISVSFTRLQKDSWSTTCRLLRVFSHCLYKIAS